MKIQLYLFLFSILSFLGAETFYVPGNFSLIQSAINAASNSDSILVWPGLYEETLDFDGKEIVVSSLYHITDDSLIIESTILDADANGSVVSFASGE
ncbi:MAG: hypothetical protein HOD18_01415, partial [Candidatus Marinimicrobia bacterium]|nr:hypothetical protein [Candidatus Neomarinimicrobiota bacterium]